MRNNQSVRGYIERARIERSIYVAELIASAIAATWHGINYAAEILLSAARAKTRNNVFTFDA